VVELSLEEVPGELDIFPTSGKGAVSTLTNQEMLVALHSQRTGRPIEEVRKQLIGLGAEFFETEARHDATGSIEDSFQTSAANAIEVTSIPDLIEADKARAEALEVAKNTEVPEVYATLAAGNRFDAIASRTASRIVGLSKIADEELARNELSVGSVALDLVDLFISAPVDALRGGGFSRTDDAIELRNLLSADIPDSEFFSRARQIIRDGADAGILTDSNFFFLSGTVANVLERGIGETAGAEELFNIVDLAGVGVGAARITRMLRNTTAFTSLMMGPEAATRVLGDAVSKPGTIAAESAAVARETPVSILRPIERNGAHLDMVAAGANITEGVEQSNTIFQTIKSAPWFRNVDPEVLQAWLPTATRRLGETVEKHARRRVMNLAVKEDDLSNIFGTITFGKSDGLPFKKRAAAEKFAKDISTSTEVGGTGVTEAKILTLPTVGEERFVVNLTKNLSSEGLVDALDATEIGQTFMRAFGGTFITLPKRLDSLAKFGESALTGVTAKLRPILEKKLSAASKTENALVERVFYELRDGDRLSQRRSALNIAEFRTEYARHSAGNALPSKAAEELYSTIQDLNDALYLLKADIAFKQVVNEGSELLQFSLARKNGDIDDWSLIVNGIGRETLEGDPVVYNVISGVQTKASELPKNQRIFAVSGGYEVGGRVAKFVTTENPKLRRVYHSDVLGYNPGGPRAYDGEFSHIVKQEVKRTDLDGNEFTANDRSIMLARSEKEALEGAQQINNIFIAFREAIPNLVSLSQGRAISAIKALRTSPELEQVVLKNNAWNTSVEDIDSLVEFLTKHKLDPRKNVGPAAKDKTLATLDDAGRPIFGAAIGRTYDDAVTSSLNQPRNGPRRDTPLLSFGGTTADTVSPLDLIQNDLMRVTHSKAFQAFNFRSVNGWLEGAQDFITTKSKAEIAGLSPLEALKKAELSTGADGRSFEAARNAILRVLNNKSNAELKWNSMVDRFGEFVYDKNWKSLSKVVRNTKTAKTPLEFLRGVTFDARLGLFDPGQLIVQASQTFNILAIVGPLRSGQWLQSMASHVPLRLAMRTDDPAILRDIGRRAAPFIGMDADEFVDWARWAKDIGRLNVGDEIAELSGTNSTLARNFVNRTRTAARVFFNEGEKVPRSAGMHVAWKEFREKFPNGDPFSDHGKRWITSRQDALTAGMTSANRAPWQRGPMSVPLQFMTYSSRMLESLFTNRVLSVTERKRLATAQVAFWGAAGTGFGAVLDGYLLESGVEMDPTQYTLLRYGALDAGLQWTTGTQAVFGGRLAMAEGFSDMLSNASQGEFLEIIGGPGGQLVTDIGLQLTEGMGNIFHGRTSLVEADLKKLVRNLTGPNKAYNAWMMFTVGDYLSRNDDVIVSGLTNTDALLHTFGGQIRDANLAYTYIEVMQDQDQSIRDHQKRIRSMIDTMTKHLESGDLTSAIEVQKQIAAAFAITPVHVQDKLRFALAPQLESLSDNVIRRGVFDRGLGLLDGSSEGE
jgi:hypothetical protein